MSIETFQLLANLSALAVIGFIYAAYVKNLKSVAAAKDSQIAIAESNVKLWRDKASELEKRTPEYIEKVLTERITVREKELQRLHQDSETHKNEIRARNEDLSRMRLELENAKDVGRSIVIYDIDKSEEVIIPNSELELEHLGEVFVDSATLMICDPMYIRTDWREEEFVVTPRKYRHNETGKVYEWEKDFTHYDDKLEDTGRSINQMLRANELVEIKPPPHRDYNFSFAGAMYASMSEEKCGALRFEHGEKGAGFVISTVHGDGGYPVYGERHNGIILRIYIDLQ